MQRHLYLLVLLLGACADPYRNFYEGAQQREGIVNPHAQARSPAVPYEQYKAERNKQSTSNKSDSTETVFRPSN